MREKKVSTMKIQSKRYYNAMLHLFIIKIGNEKVIIQEESSAEKPKKSKKGVSSKKKRKHILAVVKVIL